MSANAKTRPRRAVTAPKGRPTPRRNEPRLAVTHENSRARRLEWTVVAVLVLAVILALVVFGGDGGGTPVHGVPAGGHGG